MKFLCSLFVFCLFSMASFAATEGPLLLRSLQDASSAQIDLSHTNAVFVLFKPDCVACHKQISSLDCLPKDVNVILIGAFSNERALREEFRKFGASFPGYFGSKQLLSHFSVESSVTPQIIFSRMKQAKKVVGLKSCQFLLSQL